MDLKRVIHSIHDYPKPGIVFRDVTPLFTDPAGFGFAVVQLAEFARESGASKIAGIEARGFIIGGAIAHALNIGFAPIRKQGKLPRETIGEDYALEYGTDRIEMHIDMLDTGERVLLVDDLIATGGTAAAAATLIERTGATVVGTGFIIDLPDLGGSQALRDNGHTVHTLVEYEGR